MDLRAYSVEDFCTIVINYKYTLAAVLPNTLCEMAKGLCVLLIILLHSQMCCKRKIVKRVKNVSMNPVRHVPLKKKDLSKPKKVTGPTKRASVRQMRSKKTIGKKTVKEKKVKKIVKSSMRKEKKKDLEATQEEEVDINEDVGTKNVKWLGNLDVIREAHKWKIDEETENMKSTHEMDDLKSLKPIADPNLHIKIAEKKCILYETNDEPTLDDELDKGTI